MKNYISGNNILINFSSIRIISEMRCEKHENMFKCVCLNHNARSATRGVRCLTEFWHDATYFREKKKNRESNLKEVGSADAEVEVELKILAIFHTPPDFSR